MNLLKISLSLMTTMLFVLALILPIDIATAAEVAINAPSNLTAVLVSDYEVKLTWKDNSTNEFGFHIETATNAGFTSNLIITTPANITSYSDKTVAPTGDTYYYRVTAFIDSSNESIPSNIASVTIAIPKLTVPNAPINLTATPSGTGQINLTWTDNSTNETGFQLERAARSDFSVEAVSVMVAANLMTYTDTTVVTGKLYYYRIYANNALGLSNPSDIVSVTASASIRVPSAPTNLAAKALGPTYVRLSWSTSETDQTEFHVERATDNSFTAGVTRFTLPADITTHMTTYMDTTAIKDTTYYYRIFAVNSVGLSLASEVAMVTTPASIDTPPYSTTTYTQETASAVEQANVKVGDSIVPLATTSTPIDNPSDSAETHIQRTGTTVEQESTKGGSAMLLRYGVIAILPLAIVAILLIIRRNRVRY